MNETADFFFILYHPLFLFVWGACWGSFLNVVIYRYPLGRSVVSPGSACPHCSKAIKGYDNIPVLSWFILGGKCRACGHAYSVRYALVEAALGGVCASGALLHPENPIAGLVLGHGLLAALPGAWLFWSVRRLPWYVGLVSLCCFAVYFYQIFFA